MDVANGDAGEARAYSLTRNAVNAAGILTALGILIGSLVMLKGVFPRGIAYLGIAAGAGGMVSEAFRDTIGAGYFVYGILLLGWFIAVGWNLYKLARDPEKKGR